jgi:hypothetical protein
MLGIKCIGFLWQKWRIIQAGTHLIVEHPTFLREECLSTKHVIDGFLKECIIAASEVILALFIPITSILEKI